jgi:hypothetical protein
MKTVHISEVKSQYVETKFKDDSRYIRTLKEDLLKPFKPIDLLGEMYVKTLSRFPEPKGLEINIVQKEMFDSVKIRATILNKDEYPYYYDEVVKVVL